MSGILALQGVDRILRQLAMDAVASLNPRPAVTVGPLDSDTQGLRLNWFLYRVRTDPSYRNMEPPQRGWLTARGSPPLPLRLSYLLSAFAASTQGGDDEQLAHTALTAVALALHDSPIIGESSPLLGSPQIAPLLRPIVEPLHIAADDLDVETVTKLWTAAAKPIRLSLGYEVSVVLIDPPHAHEAGPPVQSRHVVVVPTLGPRLVSVAPDRASFGDTIRVEVLGLTAGSSFSIAAEPSESTGGDWPLTTAPGAPPGHVHLQLPDRGIAPGLRRLEVRTVEGGLEVGRDVSGLTVVPVVVGAVPALVRGTTVSLPTAHAADDVEVFLGGKRVPSVTFVSPDRVDVDVPAAVAAGPAELLLRAGKVAGPTSRVTVA